MSITKQALFGIATAIAGNQFRSLVRDLDVDDLLGPLGLARRRSHWGESLIFMGAGVVVGGAVTLALASFKRKALIAWLSQGEKDLVDGVEDVAEDLKRHVRNVGAPEVGNHHPETADATT